MTEALILWPFDPKYYIWILIDNLGYAIGELLSLMSLNQHFFDSVSLKNLIFSQSEISLL